MRILCSRVIASAILDSRKRERSADTRRLSPKRPHFYERKERRRWLETVPGHETRDVSRNATGKSLFL